MTDKTLEELGIEYWDLSHETLELEEEYKKKLSSIKAEMKEINKEFKKRTNKSVTCRSIGEFAYLSAEKREKVKQE